MAELFDLDDHRNRARLLHSVKRQIKAGDYAPLIALLQHLQTKDSLQCVREQKLLLNIADCGMQKRSLDLYKEKAHSLLADSHEREHELNYADFVLIAARARRQVESRVSLLLNNFPRVSLSVLLNTATKVLSSAYEQIQESGWSQKEEQLRKATLPQVRAAESERTLQDIAGALIDLANGAARALNEISKLLQPGADVVVGKAARAKAEESFAQLTSEATFWNTIEYYVDNVTYGEWLVSSITEGDGPQITFDIRDPRLAYSRLIGLRREKVSLSMGRKRPSFIRPSIEELLPDFLDSCLEKIGGAVGVKFGPDYPALKQKLEKLLAEFSPDDDLISAACRDDYPIRYDYIAAIALRWFIQIASFVAERRSKGRRCSLGSPYITPEELAEMLPIGHEDKRAVRDAIGEMMLDLPCERQLQICRTPFIRIGKKAVCLPVFDVSRWASDIRFKWLSNGTVGQRFGDVWESFAEFQLTAAGWTKVAKGSKLRDGVRTITDLDLVVFKDGLLLVLQIKALAGQGYTTYDHWKNRQIIECGARQSRLAVDFMRKNPDVLRGICARRVFREIKQIEMAVLTNVHAFNGVSMDGIVVVSDKGLNTIFNRGVVNFESHEGNVVVVGPQPQGTQSGEEFLRLLHSPVDWEVAQEPFEVRHANSEFEGIRWAVPGFGERSQPISFDFPSERHNR